MSEVPLYPTVVLGGRASPSEPRSPEGVGFAGETRLQNKAATRRKQRTGLMPGDTCHTTGPPRIRTGPPREAIGPPPKGKGPPRPDRRRGRRGGACGGGGGGGLARAGIARAVLREPASATEGRGPPRPTAAPAPEEARQPRVCRPPSRTRPPPGPRHQQPAPTCASLPPRLQSTRPSPPWTWTRRGETPPPMETWHPPRQAPPLPF
ncbi:hypothetical protein T484DRAFT_1962632 [Baffinella frigidus]|nr:hypothetical protein T484DRAFT_1962632 [Cryptophyta sp. CCMP2293]